MQLIYIYHGDPTASAYQGDVNFSESTHRSSPGIIFRFISLLLWGLPYSRAMRLGDMEVLNRGITTSSWRLAYMQQKDELSLTVIVVSRWLDWIKWFNWHLSKATVLLAASVAIQAIPDLSSKASYGAMVSTVLALISAISCIAMFFSMSESEIDKSAYTAVSFTFETSQLSVLIPNAFRLLLWWNMHFRFFKLEIHMQFSAQYRKLPCCGGEWSVW